MKKCSSGKGQQLKTAACFLLLFLVCLQSPLRPAEVKMLARVGTEVITSTDFAELNQPGIPAAAVLQKLVEERLLFLEAKRRGMSVPEKDLKKEFDRIAGRFPDYATFYRKLRDDSLTPAQLTRRLERQILVRRLVQDEITSQVQISPVELSAYLEQHRTELQLEKTEYRLSVAEFEKPEDVPADRKLPDEKMQDLGFLPFEDLSAQVRKALPGLKPGDYTDIVRTTVNSWAVFRVLEIKNSGEKAAPETLAVKARQKIFQEKFNAAYQQFLTGLKNKTGIEYYVDFGK